MFLPWKRFTVISDWFLAASDRPSIAMTEEQAVLSSVFVAVTMKI